MKENVVDADGSKGRLISSPSCDVRAPLQSEHTLATYNSVIYNTRQNALQTTDNGRAPTHPPWSWAWACDPSLERHHRARMAIVYMLCDAGVDVNGRDASGLTPLHYAARRGSSFISLCNIIIHISNYIYIYTELVMYYIWLIMHLVMSSFLTSSLTFVSFSLLVFEDTILFSIFEYTVNALYIL